uniref:Uncharacterized protein LOC104228545 n=1 Tax=Nicotiana sylvestris TaxID=4096 RepID=A0A1U7WL74_NICSY|nr:PREDICTED: uncharacterized protein LOC104228545 [Nicotiana sylvestris]
MLAFSSSIFPNMSSEWSFEEAQNYDQQNNNILQNEITNDLFEGLPIDHNSPSSYQQQYSKEKSFDNSLMAKKLSHNASERNRRKKMNFLYSTLRSLIPPANLKKKKLSFPATVSYVQQYIPELKKEIERLSQTKDLLLSNKAGSLVQSNNINQRNTTSSASISASPLCNGQVLVQISTTQTSFPISQVFQTLEEDGILLLNATSFKSSGEKIFHNLHFQMQGTVGMEIQSLKTKLLVMYEENQNHTHLSAYNAPNTRHPTIKHHFWRLSREKKNLVTTKDFEEKYPSANPRTWGVGMNPSSICLCRIPAMKEYCHCQDLNIIAPDLAERITYLRRETGEELTLDRLTNLYSPKIFREGMINFSKQGHHALLTNIDDYNDRGWMEQFIAVATTYIIPKTAPSFTELWNRTPTRRTPPRVKGLNQWVQKILDVTTPETRPLQGSVAIPEEDILANPADATRLLQEAFTRKCVSGPTSSASVEEQQTTSTTFVVATSQPTMPSASSPSFPALPSPLAIVTSSPPNIVAREEGVPLPQSPVHGSVGQNYVFPFEDPQKKESITLSVSTGCHLLSWPVELANYLKPLALEKDINKIQTLPGECLLNNAMHNAMVEVAPVKAQFEETRANYIEVHNDILAASDREATSAKRLRNLEAALNSKTDKDTPTEEKYARMSRNTSEEAKTGVIGFDAEIAKAHELESTTKKGFPLDLMLPTLLVPVPILSSRELKKNRKE